MLISSRENDEEKILFCSVSSVVNFFSSISAMVLNLNGKEKIPESHLEFVKYSKCVCTYFSLNGGFDGYSTMNNQMHSSYDENDGVEGIS